MQKRWFQKKLAICNTQYTGPFFPKDKALTSTLPLPFLTINSSLEFVFGSASILVPLSRWGFTLRTRGSSISSARDTWSSSNIRQCCNRGRGPLKQKWHLQSWRKTNNTDQWGHLIAMKYLESWIEITDFPTKDSDISTISWGFIRVEKGYCRLFQVTQVDSLNLESQKGQWFRDILPPMVCSITSLIWW